MDKTQAFNIIVGIAQDAKLNFQEHDMVIEALKVLRALVEPQEEEPNDSEL